MATEVINIRHEPYRSNPTLYVYIGRAGRGQGGYFGNPFTYEEHGEAAIDLFEKYFLERVVKDLTYRRRVLALRGKKLGCFCARKDKPFKCHGLVMARWIDAQPPVREVA